MKKQFSESDNERLLADIMPHLEAIKSLLNLYEVNSDFDLWFSGNGSVSVRGYEIGLKYNEWADINMRSWEYSAKERFIESKEEDGSVTVTRYEQEVA